MTAALSFVAFTATIAGISWWVTRKDRMDTSEAYFLAGRSLTAWVIAGSLMLTNLSTEHLIGLNADAFNHTIILTNCSESASAHCWNRPSVVNGMTGAIVRRGVLA